jgi:hypothetical protein
MKRLLFAAFAALLLVPASAMARDRNHDKLPDRWERAHSLSLKHKQAKHDQDADGVRNLAEFRHGLDPRDDDSDDDGTEDGDESGQVVSFDAASGELVIALLDGSQLSGKVYESTEIECGASDDNSGDDEDGDHSGRHGDGEGDDDEGDGDGDHGDDDHGDDARGAVMSDEDESGDEEGDDDDDADHDRTCSTDALIAGAKVHEAELKVTSAGKVWDEIELV